MIPMPISPAELIMLLFLWLPGQQQGQPANAQTVFRYVPARADITVSLDAGSWTASAMKGFKGLGQEAFIRRSPKFSQAFKKADRAIQQGLVMLKLMGHFDPMQDLRWITMSVDLSARPPKMLVAAGGSFQPTLVERIAAARGAKAKRLPNGRLFPASRPKKPSLGWTNDDVLLIGDRSLMEPLLRRKPRPTKLARLAMSLHDGRSFLTAAMRPKNVFAKKALRSELPRFLLPLSDSLQGIAMALRYDGLRLAFAGRNGRVLGRYRQILDGVGDYLAGAERLARGSLKIGDGLVVPQDARFFPRTLQPLVTHKAAVLRYVRRHVALAASPSHRVAIDGRHRLVTLTYNGSRYAGLVPLFGVVGSLATVLKSQRSTGPLHQRPRRAPRRRVH